MPTLRRARIRQKSTLGAAVILAALGFVSAAQAAVAAGDTARPLPRFASLRSDEVNLRTGPGTRYPIEWVLKRKDMPVEITAEFEHWRRIRLWQGDEGWVQEHMVTDKRWVIVQGSIRTLHAEPDATSSAVARLEPRVIARLIACRGDWCRIEAHDIKGWLPRGDIWGVLPGEAIP